MKDDILRTIMSLSVTLLLFSFIGIFYAAQGTAEYVVSIFAAVINLSIISVVVVMLVKKRKNNA
ncbi:hypothetical protein [Clostridium sp.]|uniref:hypothetical protein n=1 Tax=Clostridium sp. TaxID=1506 RepID=UPI002FCAF9AC